MHDNGALERDIMTARENALEHTARARSSVGCCCGESVRMPTLTKPTVQSTWQHLSGVHHLAEAGVVMTSLAHGKPEARNARTCQDSKITAP